MNLFCFLIAKRLSLKAIGHHTGFELSFYKVPCKSIKFRGTCNGTKFILVLFFCGFSVQMPVFKYYGQTDRQVSINKFKVKKFCGHLLIQIQSTVGGCNKEESFDLSNIQANSVLTCPDTIIRWPFLQTTWSEIAYQTSQTTFQKYIVSIRNFIGQTANNIALNHLSPQKRE